MTKRQTSLEITINVIVNHASSKPGDIEVVGWEFNVLPPERFHELSAQDRAALWSKLRDEIEEFWFSTALEEDEDAAWNYRLEDVDLD